MNSVTRILSPSVADQWEAYHLDELGRQTWELLTTELNSVLPHPVDRLDPLNQCARCGATPTASNPVLRCLPLEKTGFGEVAIDTSLPPYTLCWGCEYEDY